MIHAQAPFRKEKTRKRQGQLALSRITLTRVRMYIKSTPQKHTCSLLSPCECQSGYVILCNAALVYPVV